MALYCRFSSIIGITFNSITSSFEIDHDDDTVDHILSHLNTKYEPYIDCISSVDKEANIILTRSLHIVWFGL